MHSIINSVSTYNYWVSNCQIEWSWIKESIHCCESNRMVFSLYWVI